MNKETDLQHEIENRLMEFAELHKHNQISTSDMQGVAMVMAKELIQIMKIKEAEQNENSR